jgi:DNA-binding transcriptional LysR family regulator
MRLEQLEYLVVVSKCRSLSDASKRLFITQQSLGKSIMNLETELGVPLLTRTSKGCYLTNEGTTVVAEAREILDRVESLRTRFTTCPEISSSLTIVCCPAAHSSILPAAIESFSSKYPQANVTVLAKDSYLIPDLHRRLSACEDETVIGVLNIPDRLADLNNKITDDLEFYPLAEDYWVACMNKRNPLADQTSLSLKTLMRESLVMEYPDYPEVGIDRATLECYSEFGAPNVKKIVDSDALYYAAIEQNNYVGFASHFFDSGEVPDRPDIIFKEFQPAIESHIGCLYKKSQRDNQHVKTFLKCMEEQIATKM